MFDSLMTPPAWAPTWCYLYFIAALFGAITVFMAILLGYKKLNGFTLFALIVAGILTFIDSMMYFWICRASLAK